MKPNQSTVLDEEAKVITAYLSRMGKKGGSTGKGTAKSKAKTRKMLEVSWPTRAKSER
ncbi:MAG TPA: hypothetical protein VN957_08880 [Chthoniobacterales bacterium]|jgi:hypothetical protein|nr:hypothetical protein [Chthoniobacterales bacterium]